MAEVYIPKADDIQNEEVEETQETQETPEEQTQEATETSEETPEEEVSLIEEIPEDPPQEEEEPKEEVELEDYKAKYEELAKRLEGMEKVQTQPFSFKNEETAKLAAYLESSENPSEALETYTFVKGLGDISQMDDKTALQTAAYLKDKKAGLSAQESARLFEREFESNFDLDEEIDVIKLKREAVAARAELSKMRQEIDSVEPIKSSQTVDYEAQRQQWLEGVKSLNKEDFQKLSLTVGNTKFNYPVAEADKLLDSVENWGETINERYTNEDGTVNHSRMAQDLAILNNFDDIVNKLAKHYTDYGKKQYLKERQNVPDPESPNPNTEMKDGGIPKNWNESLKNAKLIS